MFSFQRRLETFGGWPTDYGVATPENLSIAGFVCVSTRRGNLTVRCVYCSKTLESWEDTDHPAREHYLHMTKCPLFNMNQMGSRMATFKDRSVDDAKALARNGFVKYNLGDSDFVFCYKCGSVDRSHVCKRMPGSVYRVEGGGDIFFYNLIEGMYNEGIVRSLGISLYIPQQMREQVGRLVEHMSKNAILRDVEESIERYVDEQLGNIERMLNRDIQRVLREMFGGLCSK